MHPNTNIGKEANPWAKNVGVFCIEAGRDDATLVIALLEVRVGEEKEEFAELSASKEVGQKLHGVAAHARDVLVRME